MVHAWVARKVAYNPTLGLSFHTISHIASDNNQMRPQHTTQTHNKHHHQGGRAINESTPPKGLATCLNFFGGHCHMVLIDTLKLNQWQYRYQLIYASLCVKPLATMGAKTTSIVASGCP